MGVELALSLDLVLFSQIAHSVLGLGVVFCVLIFGGLLYWVALLLVSGAILLAVVGRLLFRSPFVAIMFRV
jgi:hypothetical protein